MHVFTVQWERTDLSYVWERWQSASAFVEFHLDNYNLVCESSSSPPSLPLTPRSDPSPAGLRSVLHFHYSGATAAP